VAIEKEKIRSFELLVPGSTNRRLEPILLTLRKGESTPRKSPMKERSLVLYSGEGSTFALGREVLKLKRGECFYLSAEKEHWLHNSGSRETVVLWISSPPSF